jgi:adenylate cyclase
MVERVKSEREAWRSLAGEETLIGIGVNTGRASVGNTGSQSRFQYGAVGDAVNVASRLQGLTKPLRRPLLMTRATYDALPAAAFCCRRVLKAKLANIPDPVDVFAVETDRDMASRHFFQKAEAALDALEAGRFDEAVRSAGPMLEQRPDGPLRLVALRAVEALLNEGKAFEPAWEPPRK